VSTLRFVFGRLAGLAITLAIASFVIFGSLYLAPGTPLSFLTHGRTLTPQGVAQLKAQYHLNEPFFAQYWHWLAGAAHGNFGKSILFQENVSTLLGPLAVNTIFLVLYAAVIIIIIGVGVGVVAGVRPGLVDSSVMLAATVAMAIPTFVAAVVLTLVFSVDLGWFPVFGAGSGFIRRLDHLTLPAIALALMSVAFVARLTRAAVRQELDSEHVQTAYSRGLPSRIVLRRHVLRNGAVPVVTAAGLTIVTLIASSVVVEQVFQLNGLGSYLVSSVDKKDFPVVQAICLMYVAAFVVLNTLIDMAYSLLDPRISVGRRGAAS
jgi:peptide/nickel transport system permease protein